MNSVLKRFFWGMRCFVAGFRSLFAGPRVWLLSIVPALVSSSLLVGGVYLGFMHLGAVLAMLAPTGTGFFTVILAGLIKVFGFILFAIMLILAVFLVSKIIVIPFNSLIAERTLKYLGVFPEENFRLQVWIRKSIRLLIIALFQFAFFVILGALLLILSLIPVLQVLAGYIGLLIVAFDCADFSFEFANLTLRRKLDLLRARIPEFSGFALLVGLTFMVPLLNFFLLPVAVAGASHLVASFPELWEGRVSRDLKESR